MSFKWPLQSMFSIAALPIPLTKPITPAKRTYDYIVRSRLGGGTLTANLARLKSEMLHFEASQGHGDKLVEQVPSIAAVAFEVESIRFQGKPSMNRVDKGLFIADGQSSPTLTLSVVHLLGRWW
ncbi:hypothetical protein BDY21DRAFT_365972 [Lineolata rhizophorae]|uniref:Uncharacterized protein n=1 Tax=Lineolata rhizophorae TaxID=578093 RepID=A0A6A6NTB5_9PEZI|nr:hypothetical protein BDY21DRAFT_365972 [Lineolata rhizophorae]